MYAYEGVGKEEVTAHNRRLAYMQILVVTIFILFLLS